MPAHGSHSTVPEWFCLRSQPGRQNVAAAHLRSFGVEVFNPHLRQRKATRRGVEMRAEPLFPNYLFARFVFWENFRRVRYAFGVGDILRFGDDWCVLPEGDISALREQWGPGEALEIRPDLQPGQRVQLSGALFHGMEATVLCTLPARQRVKVLLEFLGGLTETEVEAAEIVPLLSHPLVA